MRDKPSFKLRLIWSQGSKAMSDAIAFEIRTICRRAAEPVRPGESIKAQLVRAWENLGRPAFWRLRSGWYGEGGAWSAAAVVDFQHRYRLLLERNARLAMQAQAIRDAKEGVRSPNSLEDARDAFRSLAARIEALEAALLVRAPNPPGA